MSTVWALQLGFASAVWREIVVGVDTPAETPLLLKFYIELHTQEHSVS